MAGDAAVQAELPLRGAQRAAVIRFKRQGPRSKTQPQLTMRNALVQVLNQVPLDPRLDAAGRWLVGLLVVLYTATLGTSSRPLALANINNLKSTKILHNYSTTRNKPTRYIEGAVRRP